MATRADVMVVLDFLAAAYQNDKIDEKTVRSWAIAFQPTPRLFLARHAMQWVEAEKWMPKIGDLLPKIRAEMGDFRVELGKKRMHNGWRPPADFRDEATMWLCFKKGCGPDELTQAELDAIKPSLEYAPVEL